MRLGLSYFQHGEVEAVVAGVGTRYSIKKQRKVMTILLYDVKAVDGSASCDHLWIDASQFKGVMVNNGDSIRFTARKQMYRTGGAYRGHAELDYTLKIIGVPIIMNAPAEVKA
jgi:hypothetical protein